MSRYDDPDLPELGDNDAPPEYGWDTGAEDDYRPDEDWAEEADPGTGEIPNIGTAEDPGLGAESGLAGLIATVQLLNQTQQDQQKQLDSLVEMLEGAPDGPWAWASLDAKERQKLWQRLYDWVEWLEERYLRNLSPSRDSIGIFPADWYRHPVAVEMLTALMVAHLAAYRRKASAPSFTLVEWHERCLWPTIARMKMLGLFPTDSDREDWEGPTRRPTRRDLDRFKVFLAEDLAETEGEASHRD